jgi:hypothetical protein
VQSDISENRRNTLRTRYVETHRLSRRSYSRTTSETTSKYVVIWMVQLTICALSAAVLYWIMKAAFNALVVVLRGLDALVQRAIALAILLLFDWISQKHISNSLTLWSVRMGELLLVTIGPTWMMIIGVLAAIGFLFATSRPSSSNRVLVEGTTTSGTQKIPHEAAYDYYDACKSTSTIRPLQLNQPCSADSRHRRLPSSSAAAMSRPGVVHR